MRDLAKLVFDLQNEKIRLEKRIWEIEETLHCVEKLEAELLGTRDDLFAKYENILGDMRLRRGEYSETSSDQ